MEPASDVVITDDNFGSSPVSARFKCDVGGGDIKPIISVVTAGGFWTDAGGRHLQYV